jgi:cytoskeleton protein RodZ
VGSFGARLKREREQRKVTLDDISAATKIGTRFLHALEDEHFDQLPGGIFNKGFVRAYARHLGLDEEQAVADYLEASGANLPSNPADAVEKKPLLDIPPEPEANNGANVPWGILAALLLVVAFGFALWGYYNRDKQKAATHPAEQSAAASNSSADSSPSPAPSDTKAATAGESAAAVLGDQSAIPVAAGQTSPVSSQPMAASSSAAFSVTVKAREDSWVAITADGKQIMQDTLVAHAERSVGAQKEITVRAGNIGALDFFFNGKKLPAQGDLGEVKTLSFDADGLEVTVSTPPPSQP